MAKIYPKSVPVRFLTTVTHFCRRRRCRRRHRRRLERGGRDERAAAAAVAVARRRTLRERRRDGAGGGRGRRGRVPGAAVEAPGDGRVGQAFFKACAAWAWALLKQEHSAQAASASTDAIWFLVCASLVFLMQALRIRLK